jgi:hypothetical protein
MVETHMYIIGTFLHRLWAALQLSAGDSRCTLVFCDHKAIALCSLGHHNCVYIFPDSLLPPSTAFIHSTVYAGMVLLIFVTFPISNAKDTPHAFRNM